MADIDKLLAATNDEIERHALFICANWYYKHSQSQFLRAETKEKYKKLANKIDSILELRGGDS